MRGRALTAAAVAGNAAVIAVAAFAISRVLQVSSNDLNVLLWLVAGALIHDMLVLPLYTVGDIAFRLGIADHPLRRVRVVNHVRGPAVVSLVLFLVYAPTILTAIRVPSSGCRGGRRRRTRSRPGSGSRLGCSRSPGWCSRSGWCATATRAHARETDLACACPSSS